ncbi:MgtC/SapB family protein [Filifactor villosus]|uniref:MgtC/SapB family protein n=1 Tax=Filifactor villosus TaxID=29374 RepID=A0ABV9QHW8_9FIRM
MYDMVLEEFRDLSLMSIFLRYMTCIVFGGLIGFERGKKNHPAGLRTHLMVCLGSASVMMVSQYIFENISSSGDPARLGAQVISGIGFLGVGTIVVTGQNQVRGLTTAAGLWASACMGLSIGIGFFEGAVILCFFMYMVLEMIHRLDQHFLKSSKIKQLYIEFSKDVSLGKIIQLFEENNCKVEQFSSIREESESLSSMMLWISYQGKDFDQDAVLSDIRRSDKVFFVWSGHDVVK